MRSVPGPLPPLKGTLAHYASPAGCCAVFGGVSRTRGFLAGVPGGQGSGTGGPRQGSDEAGAGRPGRGAIRRRFAEQRRRVTVKGDASPFSVLGTATETENPLRESEARLGWLEDAETGPYFSCA
jgi:hypothetical protein